MARTRSRVASRRRTPRRQEPPLITAERRLHAALACPRCRAELTEPGNRLVCTACGAQYPVEGEILRLLPPETRHADAERYYNEETVERYGRDHGEMSPEAHEAVRPFLESIERHALVVEIGSGRGAFDRCHPGYAATDFSIVALRAYSTGARAQVDVQSLPFKDGSLDAVFSVATLEHVPDPAAALGEIARCLRSGGRALLYPAWYVRPWASKALAQRPYSELEPADRLQKATIPLRDRRPYQFLRVLPGRLRRELSLRLGGELELGYQKLKPNLTEFLVSDSDAFTSLDPQAVAAYFISRGYRDLRRTSAASRLLYAYEPVIVEKPLDPFHRA